MAEFAPFDLGRVIQTAEAIKALRRQGSMDKLQAQYLGQQIESSKYNMERQQKADAVVLGKEKAQTIDVKASQILQAPNPKNYVEQNEPDLVKNAAANGVDWQTLDDDGVRQLVTQMQNRARQELGAAPLSTEQVGGFNTLQQGGRILATQAPKQATPDPLVARWQMEVQSGYTGSLLDYQKELKAAGRRPAADTNKPPSGYRATADGNLEAIPGGPATRAAKTGNVTEGERKAAALATRLESAMNSLDAIEKADPGASQPGIGEKIAGAFGETAANVVRSSGRQQADAAQLDALDAALTLATGAAYTREQLLNLKKSYFPQLGDSDENIKAKAKRFETIVKTARIASGRAESSVDKALGAPQPSNVIPVGQSVQVGQFTLKRIN